MNQTKLIVIGGPTCSGKTKFAVNLAKKVNGELINADSRQIYKYLDVGTNKGQLDEINGEYFIDGIKIHLVSFLEPNEIYSIYQFQKDARDLIKKIHNKGNQPILVGGTGLYIDAVIKNYQLNESTVDLEKRNELEKLSLEELIEMLKKISPDAYSSLNESDSKNKRRIVRLIELKGIKFQANKSESLEFNVEFYYPKYNWDELKTQIDQRVNEMFTVGTAQGLSNKMENPSHSNIISETQKVLEMVFKEDCIPLSGIGYKDVIRYLNHEQNLESTINNVQQAYRQYARRQRTWFEGEGRGYKFTYF